MIALLLALQLAAPDPTLTPGVVRPGFTKTQACTTRWGLDVRRVTVRMKREVARRYGLPHPTPFPVEYDHLIPRALGGADHVDNLWPQPWPEARKGKDPEEVAHWRAVCAGRESLAEAQRHFRAWGQR